MFICECSQLNCEREMPDEVYAKLEKLGDRQRRPWYIVHKDHLDGLELTRLGEWILEYYEADTTPATQAVGGSGGE